MMCFQSEGTMISFDKELVYSDLKISLNKNSLGQIGMSIILDKIPIFSLRFMQHPLPFCVLGEWYSLKTRPKNKLMQFRQELWHVEATQRGQTCGFQHVSRLLLWPDIYRSRALLFLRGAVGMKKKIWFPARNVTHGFTCISLWHLTQYTEIPIHHMALTDRGL